MAHERTSGEVCPRVDGFSSKWKYVTVKRRILFIEHSMDWGAHRAVFEPIDERPSAPTAGLNGPSQTNAATTGSDVTRR